MTARGAAMRGTVTHARSFSRVRLRPSKWLSWVKIGNPTA